jgi:hypothetical protein
MNKMQEKIERLMDVICEKGIKYCVIMAILIVVTIITQIIIL